MVRARQGVPRVLGPREWLTLDEAADVLGRPLEQVERAIRTVGVMRVLRRLRSSMSAAASTAVIRSRRRTSDRDTTSSISSSIGSGSRSVKRPASQAS